MTSLARMRVGATDNATITEALARTVCFRAHVPMTLAHAGDRGYLLNSGGL